jgi:hypothetical protein
MLGDRMGESMTIPVAIYKVACSNASKVFMLKAMLLNCCFGPWANLNQGPNLPN